MKTAPPIWQILQAAAAVALALCFGPGCKQAAPPAVAPKTAASKTNAAAPATNEVSAQCVSVFEDLTPPKGRDPFFPNSHRRDPIPVMPVLADRPQPASELVLKGTGGSAGHRWALINNLSLEIGENGTVRVPGGRVRLKCVEIGEVSAVVQVEGEIQPKRLELRKKGS